MREIKFRAWDKSKKQMLYVQDIHNNLLEYWFSLAREDLLLMQYTSLKDKNSKEIYEGDIVRQKTGRSYSEVRVVEFHDGAFRFTEQKTPHAGFVYSNKDTEVIGNIYENKELLK